ncbi:MAG: amino acid adenylation domain-containing protein, partial [Legionellaceae bacterium]|nr:amino acid adenylation domain-containing protein [Legionellaceae bacterium]
RDTSRHPVFQVMYTVQYGDVDDDTEEGSISLNYDVAKFDLSIALYITPHSIKGEINYATSLFKQETIERFIRHYQQILNAMLTHQEQAISKYPMLTQAEYQQIVIDWNQTEKDYPKDKTIHQLFEAQVKKTPNNIAVVFEDQQLTYKQLNEEANQLARYIRKQNPSELIAICMDRSLEMIVAILGVLKAGCAYVPIDPNYPQARIDYILADTKANLVLDNSLKDKPYRQESKQNIKPLSGPDDLAYVIYTSGTTGKPKGVMIEHRSVVNYFSAVSSYLPIDIHRFDFSTNLAFDLSVTTTLVPLLLGKTIIVYGDSLEDAANYVAHLQLNKIDFIKSTPSYLSQALSLTSEQLHIKRCFLGGEPVTASQLISIGQHVQIILDEYGPTETTVGVSIIEKDEFINKKIGKPYSNCRVYVLDGSVNPKPIGAVGELYIGGAGVARGYLNQPELTKERFIANPFGEGRLYKTGDLVRWLS